MSRLTILLSSALVLTSAMVTHCQYVPTSSVYNCIDRMSAASENTCNFTRNIVGNNSVYDESIMTNLIEENSQYIILFSSKFFAYHQDHISVKLLQLCRRESLYLTPSDLNCTLDCTVKENSGFAHAVSIECGKMYGIVDGSSTVIIFELNDESCHRDTTVVIIDNDSKFIYV